MVKEKIEVLTKDNKKVQLNSKEKRVKIIILRIIAAFLSVYLLINLFIYATGRINHFTFWLSLIVIWLLSWKIVPNLRRKIESS